MRDGETFVYPANETMTSTCSDACCLSHEMLASEMITYCNRRIPIGVLASCACVRACVCPAKICSSVAASSRQNSNKATFSNSDNHTK